jgi:hypothetical protein
MQRHIKLQHEQDSTGALNQLNSALVFKRDWLPLLKQRLEEMKANPPSQLDTTSEPRFTEVHDSTSPSSSPSSPQACRSSSPVHDSMDLDDHLPTESAPPPAPSSSPPPAPFASSPPPASFASSPSSPARSPLVNKPKILTTSVVELATKDQQQDADSKKRRSSASDKRSMKRGRTARKQSLSAPCVSPSSQEAAALGLSSDSSRTLMKRPVVAPFNDNLLALSSDVSLSFSNQNHIMTSVSSK